MFKNKYFVILLTLVLLFSLVGTAFADDGGTKDKDKDKDKDRTPNYTHPVLAVFSEALSVDGETIANYRTQGVGFGVMAKLYSFTAGGDIGVLLALRQGGMGWGQIWKDFERTGKPGIGNMKDKKDNPGNGGAPPGQTKDKDQGDESEDDGD